MANPFSDTNRMTPQYGGISNQTANGVQNALSPGGVTGGVSSGLGGFLGEFGGLTTGIAAGFTPQNNFTANSPLDLEALNSGINYSQQGLQQTQDGQQALAQALLAQSQGQGPNPAQAMLHTATDQNLKQNAGLIASQKGINPGLAARQIQQNAAATNQQAAGKAASMGAEQQLASQQGLASVYGQVANQNLSNISTSGQLANQASLGAQGINANVSAQNAAAVQKTAGGLMGALGGGISGMFYKGGSVPGYADGGEIGDDSISWPAYQASAPASPSIPTQIPSVNYATGDASGASDKSKGGGGGGMGSMMGMLALLSDGGKVPGKATFGGDDPKNDTVPAMLSPGEIVIPRTASHSLESAKAFIDKEMANRQKGKKVSLKRENNDSYELEHPNGSTFKIAKNGISEKLAGQIKKMGQKLNEGDGNVQPDLDLSIPNPSASDIQLQLPNQAPGNDPIAKANAQFMNSGPGIASGITGAINKIGEGVAGIDEKALAESQNQPPPQMANISRQPTATDQNGQLPDGAPQMPGFGATTNPYNPIFDKQMALASAQGKLQDISLMHQAQAYDKYLTSLAEQQRMSDDVHKKFQTDQDQLHSAIVNTNIDPNKFWGSKTTGSKVSTGIGLMLSGMGAGLAGGPNLAYQMLQSNIDRDIDAQKTDLGKKQNLYSMNLQKYRDDLLADQATRAQLLTVASAQLQKQAALDGSPQALLNAQINMNQIRLQKAQINQQFATGMAKNAFYGAANANQNMEGGAPAQYEGMYRSNPAFKDVPIARIGNRIYPAVSKEAAEEQRQLEPLAGNVIENLDKLQKMSTGWAKLSPDQRAEADILRGQLLADIPKLKSVEIGGKRIPESEIHLAEGYLGDPKAFSQMMTAGPRNLKLMDTMIGEVERKRAANVIGYRGMHSIAAKHGFK